LVLLPIHLVFRYVNVDLLNVNLYRFMYVNTGKSCFAP
jgi:hypothetical protein